MLTVALEELEDMYHQVMVYLKDSGMIMDITQDSEDLYGMMEPSTLDGGNKMFQEVMVSVTSTQMDQE